MKTRHYVSAILPVALLFLCCLASCNLGDTSNPKPESAANTGINVKLSATCGTCNWYGTSYPLCCTDTGGWGWENNLSCISVSVCNTQGGATNPPTATDPPAATNPPSGGNCGTCSWYGTSYPLCCTDTGGWGWENNQSCVSVSVCNTQGSATNPPTATNPPSSSGSCPSSVSCPGSATCGCYTVSGLGSNKNALTSAGANQYMIASAMMETELMNTNYSFCDGKSGDSCCCGVTKANFYASRTAGASYSDYNSFCNALNGSRSTDVANWNRLRSYWGSKYWAVHRNGESGNTNPNTNDINQFKSANDWTNNNIGSHMSDDVRFWVNVPAI